MPTEITQEVHALRVAYNLTDATTLRAQVPFVTQSTDHILSEPGDTPRAPEDQQLPYTMQLGSGTWDLPLFMSFRKYEAAWDWGVDASYTLRTGKNDRDYRLGDKASIGGWLIWKGASVVRPGIRLDYRWQGDIDGEDASLRVPNPAFPYPAPVTNPNAFGGDQVDLTVFVRAPFADSWYVEAAYSQPIYLDLSGPQTSEKFHFSIEIGTSF